MTPFTFNAKKINIPAGYHELTVRQFQELSAMADKKDLCRILEIFTGIAYKEWFEADLTQLNIEQLQTSLNWTMETYDFNALSVPNKITIGKKTVSVPKDLAIKTLGQKIHFEQIVIPVLTKGGSLIDCMAEALAIYLQPLYTGEKFNPDDMEPMIKLCTECKMTEAFPVVSFFLKKYFGSEKKKPAFNTRKMRSSLQQEFTS